MLNRLKSILIKNTILPQEKFVLFNLQYERAELRAHVLVEDPLTLLERLLYLLERIEWPESDARQFGLCHAPAFLRTWHLLISLLHCFPKGKMLCERTWKLSRLWLWAGLTQGRTDVSYPTRPKTNCATQFFSSTFVKAYLSTFRSTILHSVILRSL